MWEVAKFPFLEKLIKAWFAVAVRDCNETGLLKTTVLLVMIFFFPAQPYCCIIPKHLLSWAHSTRNKLGVLALFLAETSHGNFHHHRQQLALIGTLGSSRTERSVMEWAGRTNYPFASGSELIGSAWSCSLPAASAEPRRWIKEEFILCGCQTGVVRKASSLSGQNKAAELWPPNSHKRSLLLHPILPHPFLSPPLAFSFFL